MKRGTPRHKKMYALAAALKIEHAHAVGIMEMLWHHAAEFAKQGDIGTLDDVDIAAAVKWTKKPEQLISALVSTGWLHRHEVHRLYIHDWPDHCEQSVKKFLERQRPPKKFLSVYDQREDIVQTLSGQSPDGVRPSREAEAMAKAEAKGLEENSNLREFRKPATPRTESDPDAGVSVTGWTQAGFENAEAGEMWFQALVVKHPNRKGNTAARTAFLERVLIGQFNRSEFERWYEEQVPIWQRWPMFPNLHSIFTDGEWRFPTAPIPKPQKTDRERGLAG